MKKTFSSFLIFISLIASARSITLSDIRNEAKKKSDNFLKSVKKSKTGSGVKDESTKDPLNYKLPIIRNRYFNGTEGHTHISIKFEIEEIINDNSAFVYPIEEIEIETYPSNEEWVSAINSRSFKGSRTLKTNRKSMIILKGYDYSKKIDNGIIELKNDQLVWCIGVYKRGSSKYRIYTRNIEEAKESLAKKKTSK